jgi:hypothetical protein
MNLQKWRWGAVNLEMLNNNRTTNSFTRFNSSFLMEIFKTTGLIFEKTKNSLERVTLTPKNIRECGYEMSK